MSILLISEKSEALAAPGLPHFFSAFYCVLLPVCLGTWMYNRRKKNITVAKEAIYSKWKLKEVKDKLYCCLPNPKDVTKKKKPNENLIIQGLLL